ncbi:MAG: phosphate uptake regulator PhoU [Candidatus Nezhaarchaeota archaeon]|nr:phosphate uptake regulator PhoU [Candidatus Nezhaarchaeota archaeon]
MKRDFGSRKIQCVGRGSYIVSLPKEWVQEIGIDKGSELVFKVQDDGSALLIPRKILETRGADEEETREFWLHVNPGDDTVSVCREIMALYAVSAEVIRLKFSDKATFHRHRISINNLVKNMLLGAEIIEEEDNEVTIQILIDNLDLPVEKAIRRMAILTLMAHREALSMLRGHEEDLSKNIMDLYNDVTRLNLYVLRQLKHHLERNMYRNLNFKSPKEFLGYRMVLGEIKNMANSALNIVKTLAILRESGGGGHQLFEVFANEEAFSKVAEFDHAMQQLFESSLRALFRRDYKGADEILSRMEECSKQEKEIAMFLLSGNVDPNSALIIGLMLDASRKIMECSRNIAEIALHRSVEEFLSPRRTKGDEGSGA